MRTFWPFAANVLFFACAACVLPFLILYYQRLGFSGPQIGLLNGLAPLVAMVSAPLWTHLADATRRHRLVVSLIIVLAATCLVTLTFLTSFVPVLLVALLLSACFLPIISFIDSATMFMLEDRQEMYGRVRLGGTFGYGAVGYFLGVLIQNYGLRLAFWGAAAVLLLALITAQNLHFGTFKHDEPQRGSVRTLLADRSWPPFLALAFAGGMATLIATNYLFAYMKELDASEPTMGLALTMGTVSEFPVLFFGNRLLQRFKPYTLFMLAMVITGTRLLLFSLTSTPKAVLAVELLSGLAYPLMWLAGVAYAHQHAPAGLAATAQGLFGAMVFGIGAAVGGFAGGPLFERLGGRNTYLVFGLLVLAIVLGVALVQRRQPASGAVHANQA
jgi:PPP family 3-phenylpropionic acid transporter